MGGDSFELRDLKGETLQVTPESGCPTVDKQTGEVLIQLLEGHESELSRRLMSLKADAAGSVQPVVWEQMKKFKERFPEVPDELVVRTIPTGAWSGDELPWNRRRRRRWAEAQSIVVHLFSGKDQAWWSQRLDEGGRATVCVDTGFEV